VVVTAAIVCGGITVVGVSTQAIAYCTGGCGGRGGGGGGAHGRVMTVVWHAITLSTVHTEKLMWPSVDERTLKLLGIDGESAGAKPGSPTKNARMVRREVNILLSWIL
jgi:hypothetical protein